MQKKTKVLLLDSSLKNKPAVTKVTVKKFLKWNKLAESRHNFR